jgi:hypothetical protein
MSNGNYVTTICQAGPFVRAGDVWIVAAEGKLIGIKIPQHP